MSDAEQMSRKELLQPNRLEKKLYAFVDHAYRKKRLYISAAVAVVVLILAILGGWKYVQNERINQANQYHIARSMLTNPALSEDERLRASEDILNNPFPITKKGLSQGKELYEISCAICHGKKLDGDGFLVSDDNPNVKYPAQPANFLMDKFIDKSNGFYYFAIMKGKNVMGSYADKLSYKERWDVIHYIRSVQAKKKGLKYNENENTFSEYAWAVNDSKHGVSHEGNASHGGMHVSATLTQHGSQVIDGHNTAAIKTVEGQTTEHKKDGWIKRTIKKGKEKVSDFKEKRAAKKAAKGNH